MPNIITVDEVRRVCGINETQISDTDVEEIIDEVEDELPRFLNTHFIPKEKIEIRDGNDTRRLMLNRTPVLALRELKIDGTSITIDGNIRVNRKSGKIELDNEDGDPEETFFKQKANSISIRYLFGLGDEGTIETTTTSENSIGTSIAVSVSDESDFSSGDWIDIYGMDGNREVANIESTTTGQITVDELRQTHDSGSKVVKIVLREITKRYLRIVSAISMVARVAGQSYDETVGYDLGELHVQKGEPYTQWRETFRELTNERDRIAEKLKPQFAIK